MDKEGMDKEEKEYFLEYVRRKYQSANKKKKEEYLKKVENKLDINHCV
ncbi:MAG: hypothetical protein ACOX2O_08195 [Bdellovibrionota bacterium]|jgi:hypothetical protein